LVLIHSRDGERWSREPTLVFSHPLGGCQDGGLLALRDGSIVCHSYAWARLNEDAPRTRPLPAFTSRPARDFGFLGGFVLRSDNGGNSWQGPFSPPPMPHPQAIDALGNRIPMFNRGSMCEARDGTLFWAARSFAGSLNSGHYRLHLLASRDRGETWTQTTELADPTVSFTETSLLETPRGDLVGFVRARRMAGNEKGAATRSGTPPEDQISVVVRSKDRGRSFQPWVTAPFFGFPFHLLPLPDGRVWLCL
jgi:hypothetical protein